MKGNKGQQTVDHLGYDDDQDSKELEDSDGIKYVEPVTEVACAYCFDVLLALISKVIDEVKTPH